MFEEARLKLTAFYLTILMIVLVFFSLIVYQIATRELRRIEKQQVVRRPGVVFVIDKDLIDETRGRILFSLIVLNTTILFLSGVSGYFLAGKTLKPIAENLQDQKEFVSNASHQLRTPLASIKSEIEVFLRDPKVKLEDAKNLVKSNLEEIDKMTKLSNYLLRLDKLQQGRNSLNFEKINLKDIADEIAKREKIKLKSDIKETYIFGNKESIQELISILIDNAKKYSENKKDIVITVYKKSFSVSDKGVGISENDMPHIFERFYRGNSVGGRSGYGIGLSIAKHIVDLHKAKILVESKLGFGSTFKVIFS